MTAMRGSSQNGVSRMAEMYVYDEGSIILSVSEIGLKPLVLIGGFSGRPEKDDTNASLSVQTKHILCSTQHKMKKYNIQRGFYNVKFPN